MSSTNDALFAKALLSIHNGTPFEPSILETLRSICASPHDTSDTIHEPSPKVEATPEKPKPRRKITKVAVADKVLAAVAEPVAEPVAESVAEPVAESKKIPVYVNDVYKTHKHRLQTLDPTKCMGRKCVNTHLVVGTRTEDKAIGAKGRIYIEYQCGNKPADPGPLAPNGGLSRLCQTHLDREAKYKTDTTKVWAEWFGRHDDVELYHNSRIIGSGYFFEKYPKGLANDPTTAPPANELILEAPAETTAEPPAKAKRGRKPKVTSEPKGSSTPAGIASDLKESVAVNIAPKEAEWISFKHEGRMHIRNVETGSTYWVDATKKGIPSEMAVKERYVGKWIDGALDTLADTDDDAE